LGYGIIVPLIPIYASQLGASTFQLGLIFASYSIIQLATMVPFGLFADRIGRKPFLLVGMFGLAITTFTYTLANTVNLLIIARALQGLAAAASWTAGMAIISETFPPERRGEASGIVNASMACGLISGPIIGGVLADIGGYALPFYFCALWAVAIGFIILIKIKEFRRTVSWEGILPTLKSVAANRNMLTAFLIVILCAFGLSFLEPFFPLYLADRFNASRSMIGLIFGTIMVPLLPALPLFGRASDRIGRRPLIIAGIASYGVAFPFLILANSIGLIILVTFILGLTLGSAFAPVWPLITDTLTYSGKTDTYGAGAGIYNTFWAIGYVIGPLAGGIFISLIGLKLMFFSYAATVVLGAIIASAIMREPKSYACKA